MKNTIFSYFYMGDMGVKVFFVLGGYFISYSLFSKDKGYEIVLLDFVNRAMKLIIPSLFIITITAGIYFVRDFIDRNYGGFSVYELLYDFKKIVVGDKDYIPYYAYQLWYIHYMLEGYFYGFIFCIVFNKAKIRIWIYGVVIWIFFVMGSDLCNVFLGIFAGDMVCLLKKKEYYISGKKKKSIFLLALIILIISPFTFSGSNIAIERSALSVCIALFLFLMAVWEYHSDIKEIGLVDFIDRYTYAIYLTHALIIETFSKAFYSICERLYMNEYVVIIYNFIFTIIITFGVSVLFDKYFISKVKIERKHIVAICSKMKCK